MALSLNRVYPKVLGSENSTYEFGGDTTESLTLSTLNSIYLLFLSVALTRTSVQSRRTVVKEVILVLLLILEGNLPVFHH
jgi:hypothetical protein